MNKSTTADNKFEFVDDLPTTRRELLEQFADALRSNPGRWAKFPWKITDGSARNYAAHINSQNNRGPKALVSGDFEAKAMKGTLFVRHIGGEA